MLRALLRLLLSSALCLSCASYGSAEVRQGPAVGQQEIVLPAPRPLIAGLGAAANQPLFPLSVESDRFLRLATGPILGGYYSVGGALCDLMNQDLASHRIECLVRPTDGSAANIALVLSGGAEMGLVQSDWQSFAVTAAEQATDSPLNFDRLRSVAALYPLALQIVVRDSDGITSLDTLAGQRLGLPMVGSGQRQLADVVLAQADLPRRDISIIDYADDAAMARAFCAQEIEAFFLVGPAPIQSVNLALSRCGGQLLQLDLGLIETVLGDREALRHLELSSRFYPAQRTQVATLGFVVTLVASASLEDRLVAEVARHLVDGVASFSRAHPALTSVDSSSLFSGGLTAPVHNGVARYLDTLAADFQAEAGVSVGGDASVQ